MNKVSIISLLPKNDHFINTLNSFYKEIQAEKIERKKRYFYRKLVA